MKLLWRVRRWRRSFFRSLFCRFLFSPYWLARRIRFSLPIQRLNLSQNAESLSLSVSFLLRFLRTLPLRILFSKIHSFSSFSFSNAFLRGRQFFARRSLWRSFFFLVLWTFELQGDLFLEEELWYLSQRTPFQTHGSSLLSPRTLPVVFRELTPKRIQRRRRVRLLSLPTTKRLFSRHRKYTRFFWRRRWRRTTRRIPRRVGLFLRKEFFWYTSYANTFVQFQKNSTKLLNLFSINVVILYMLLMIKQYGNKKKSVQCLFPMLPFVYSIIDKNLLFCFVRPQTHANREKKE